MQCNTIDNIIVRYVKITVDNGEHNWGLRRGDTGRWSSRAGWLDGEDFANVHGLGIKTG